MSSTAASASGLSWFIKVNDDVYGPYSLQAMQEFGEIERINGQSMVAESETGPFFPASSISAFFKNAPHHKPSVVNIRGAFCPACGNRNSNKHTSFLGFLMTLIVGVFTLGLGLILFAFLPHEWKCNECKHRWKA